MMIKCDIYTLENGAEVVGTIGTGILVRATDDEILHNEILGDKNIMWDPENGDPIFKSDKDIKELINAYVPKKIVIVSPDAPQQGDYYVALTTGYIDKLDAYGTISTYAFRKLICLPEDIPVDFINKFINGEFENGERVIVEPLSAVPGEYTVVNSIRSVHKYEDMRTDYKELYRLALNKLGNMTDKELKAFVSNR